MSDGTALIKGKMDEFKALAIFNIQAMRKKASVGKVIKPGVIGPNGKPVMPS